MTYSAVSPAHDPSVCWTCRRGADPDCVKHVTLENRGGPNTRDPMGCEVVATGSTETVRVSIPRCRACRAGARVREAGGIFACLPMLACGGGSAAAFNYLTGIDWDSLPGAETLPSLFVVAVGMTIGWVGGYYAMIAVACLVLGARRKRPPADKHFPLIAALLARGWTWPSTD